MRILTRLIFIAFCVFFMQAAQGQQTYFIGKLVNERDEPVGGAKVRMYKAGNIVELTTNSEGFFTTNKLPPENYFVDFNTGKRIVRSVRVLLQLGGNRNTYYNFKLYAKGATVSLMRWNRETATLIRNP